MTKRTATTRRPRYSLANQSTYTLAALGASVVGLSSDRTTFYGSLSANRNTLAISTNVADNPGAPTWTSVTTFANVSTSQVRGVVELSNGELLVSVVSTVSAVAFGRIFKSSGWNKTNPTAATWSLVLSGVAGDFAPHYSAHQFCHGSNGVVIMAENGAQTVGGAGNDATDSTNSAVRLWVSTDFGSTWTLKLNLRDYATAQGFQYAAGLHWHGVAYQQNIGAQGRLWACYGDQAGDGKNVAGAGYTEILYSDDLGANWSKLPNLPHFGNASLVNTTQAVTFACSGNTIVFTPENNVQPPHPVVADLNSDGSVKGARLAHTATGGVNGLIRRSGSIWTIGGRASNTSGAGTYTPSFLISRDLKSFDRATVTQVNTGSTAVGVDRVLGPTLTNKMLAVLATGNVVIGDLTLA